MSARVLPLSTAVAEIKEACEDSKAGQRGAPFFFLVGAGISCPQVPLAGEIIEKCKKRAAELGREETPERADPLNAYSHWFEQAFPHPLQRQRFLADLIRGKNISQANFRLAHLLLNEDPEIPSIANLVVTVNFDDFLSRALRIFVKHFVMSDHPATSIRIDPEKDDPLQLVHVHGTYQFYDCKNLREEIAGTAAADETRVDTMGSLLDAVLRRRSPLVVGYSGWEGDVVMKALARRLTGQTLPYNLYWFCYRREQVAGLPDWLREHPYVRFVAPRQEEPRVSAPQAFEPSNRGDVERQPAMPETPGATKGQDGGSTLPAHLVFDRLIQKFGLPEPRLCQQPFQFLGDQLASVFPTEDLSSEGGGAYSLAHVVDRIRSAASLGVVAPAEKKSRGAKRRALHLEAFRQAIRRAQYREALGAWKELGAEELPAETREELLESLFTAGTNLLDDSEDELTAYEAVIDLAPSDTELPPELRKKVATAMLYRGLTLEAQGHVEEALAAYQAVVDRFGGEEELSYRQQVAQALFNCGFCLGQLERYEESLASYDAVVERYGESTDEVLQNLVATALFNKGVRLGELGRGEEEIDVYDEIVHRFAGLEVASLREAVAKALYNKGARLRKLERDEEADRANAEVIERFGHLDEPALQETVGMAQVNQGFSLLSHAKERWAGGDEQEARSLLAEAESITRSALERLREEATALGNLAYILFLQGREGEARETLRQAVELGGERIRDMALADLQADRLPRDDGYEVLVRSVTG